jgi:hypothetical protein
MSQRDYDPLDIIPDPDVIRRKLQDVERKAGRLRSLLKFSEQIHEEKVLAPDEAAATGKAVSSAS